MDNLKIAKDIQISDIDFLSDFERNELDNSLTGKDVSIPKDLGIIDIIEKRVQEYPDRIAIECNDQRVSYKGLQQRVNKIAKILIRKGVKQNTIVGIMFEHSIDLVLTILGVLKSGATYLPIDYNLPDNRINFIIKDSNLSFLLVSNKVIKEKSYIAIKRLMNNISDDIIITTPRSPITDLSEINIIDRSVIDYTIYHKYIGQATIKNNISLQATRGCPYKCAYCHKIWPKKHFVRDAKDIFDEVLFYNRLGVKNFSFIDDIFNLNIKNSSQFYEMVIKNKLDVRFYFPNGLRGDILNKDYIDLMIEAGVVQMSLALETASPRIQELINKRLKIDNFYNNVDYICSKYPNVIVDLFTMHGFPTETEEEAMMTLDFIKSVKWLHFPYINILKIYPNTDMYDLATRNGISEENINASEHLGHHELPKTLPFGHEFTLRYQTEFLNEYFLNRERLLHVLPHQMKLYSEDELIQKYTSYLPIKTNNFTELLKQMKIGKNDLPGIKCKDDNEDKVCKDFKVKLKEHFKYAPPKADALRILLIDLSQTFNEDATYRYNVVETPIGLMYILNYLRKKLGASVNGKIIKSGIDFNSYQELYEIVDKFKPDLIGARTIIFFKEFFHKSVSMIKNFFPNTPIIAGGPYATSNYKTVFNDNCIDYVVLGEGEITFYEFIKTIIESGNKIPNDSKLKEINGIAFRSTESSKKHRDINEIIMIEELIDSIPDQTISNIELSKVQQANYPYIIYTSGSTGNPKGSIITRQGLINYISWAHEKYNINDELSLPLYSSISFDLTVTSLFAPLYSGSRIVIYTNDEIGDVLQKIFTNPLNKTVKITPSHLKIIPHLKINKTWMESMIVGGEKLDTYLCEEVISFLNKNIFIYNEYGPTEATVGCMIYKYDDTDTHESVPIGEPINNVSINLLDDRMQAVPEGVKGEIYIGGSAVSVGYLNKPELTKNNFIDGDITRRTTLYRTGDVARLIDKNMLEYIDRIDNQVKVNGHRIELGEIETSLLHLDRIDDAVVLAKHSGKNDLAVCAYYVSDFEIDQSDINEELLEYLPEYMLPQYCIQIEKIPLNANGKLDKKALPDPKIETGKEFVAPVNVTEEKLVDIWAEILNIEKKVIGTNKGFFELGGHSLRVTLLINKISKVFNIKITIKDIFNNQTVKEQAEIIELNNWLFKKEQEPEGNKKITI